LKEFFKNHGGSEFCTWWVTGYPNVPQLSIAIEDVFKLVLANIVAQVANVDLNERSHWTIKNVSEVQIK
jgi:hypothetical protein